MCSGAGAAALACLDLLRSLGIRRENIYVADIEGVVYEGRTKLMDEHKIVLRAEDVGAHARRHPARRRRLPRAVRRARAEARVARDDGAEAAHPRARQSRARDHAGRREGGAARRGHRHRALGLSEPGQQRPVLPVHLPRRARRRRHDDQRGDEARMRARDRRPRDGRAIGHRRARVQQRREPSLRSRLPDSQAVRSAPHREDRAGGGQGGDGLGCRDAPDRRFRRVPPEAHAVRVSLRPADEADLHGGEGGAQAHRVRGRRGRARAARGAGRRRRGTGETDPRRPARGDREAARALRPAHAARDALRHDQPGARRPLQGILDGVLPPHAAARRVAGVRARSRCAGA